MDGRYPRMLFKDGSAVDWDGKWVDTLIVADEAEESAAIADGWRHGREAEPARKRKVSEV